MLQVKTCTGTHFFPPTDVTQPNDFLQQIVFRSRFQFLCDEQHLYSYQCTRQGEGLSWIYSLIWTHVATYGCAFELEEVNGVEEIVV